MIEVDQLMLEITRDCNFACRHCLRGDAEKYSMRRKTIKQTLDQISHINSLIFTGGEPFLRPRLIDFTLEEIQRRKIQVGYFYIVTNGACFPRKTLDLLETFKQNYAYEGDLCAVTVSRDQYHEEFYTPQVHQNLQKMEERYSYFDWIDKNWYRIGNGRYKGYFPEDVLIAEGRAMTLSTRKDFYYDSIHLYGDAIEGELYINAKGYVIDSCSVSYENQENRICCHHTELEEFYNALKSGGLLDALDFYEWKAAQ